MTYEQGLLISKVEAKGEILEHPETTTKAFQLGKEAVEKMQG